MVLFDEDTNNVSAGEQVVITGSIQKIRKNNTFLPFLFATSIEYENREELVMTEQDKEEIQAFTSSQSKETDVIDVLVSKFGPSIIGYEYVKKGLLFCAANTGEDSVSKRLRINALLVGETGLNKSGFLMAAQRLVPNSRYASTPNSSVKSLIAVVAKEEDG